LPRGRGECASLAIGLRESRLVDPHELVASNRNGSADVRHSSVSPYSNAGRAKMDSSFCQWLKQVEDEFRGMTAGVFRFIPRIPSWVCYTLLDVVGPVTIRLFRVAGVITLWLTVVFGPVVLAGRAGVASWVWELIAVWVIMALVGSVWGRARLVRKHRAGANGASHHYATPLALD
jgi:hypothetical protein